MSKASYNDHEFFDWVQTANETFEEGRDGRAFRILNRALKHYEKDIPAYIYFKYFDLWQALEEEYEVDYEIEQMPDSELSARISNAMKKNRLMKIQGKKFQREAKGIFKGYLQDRTSIAELNKQLTAFEKEHLSNEELTDATEEEIIAIFRAYFYGRQVVCPAIVDAYARLLRIFFDCETLEDQLRNHAEIKMEEDNEAWPKPLKYAVRVSVNPPSWVFVDVDPTIHECSTIRNAPAREEENMMAMIRSMLRFEGVQYEKSTHYNGCRIISNWFSLMDQYPQLMDKFIKRGKEYSAKRAEHLKKEKWNQEQKLLRLSTHARERIVKIWNAWDEQWIDVAMGV